MTSRTAKQYDDLLETLVTNLSVDFFGDDEIDFILNEIHSYDPQVRQNVLALALALSHASSSLVPRALGYVKTAARSLPPDDLGRWIGAAFDLRDQHGLDEALLFLSRVAPADLAAFHAREGLSLREAAPLLETYVSAISGRQLRILPDKEPYTDTESIFLPAFLKRCPDRDANLALYKLAAAYCWAQIALGSLTPGPDSIPASGLLSAFLQEERNLVSLFSGFPERQLALDLYTLIEAFRAEYFLTGELPGLLKQATAFKHMLHQERNRLAVLSEKSAFVEGLWQFYLAGKLKGRSVRNLTGALSSLYGVQYEAGPRESVNVLFDLYHIAAELPGDYAARPVPLFVPRIRPDKVAARIRELRQGRRRKLEGVISQLLAMPDLRPPRSRGRTGEPGSGFDPSKEYLLIKGKALEVDEDVRTIVEEQGGIPGFALVQGSAIGGEGRITLLDLSKDETEGPGDGGGRKYDEWDYRRRGYKKGWCSLYEHEVRPAGEPFVELTLKRYGGYVTMLRKKFELLKRERRLSRRQKDGDEIDFDALVEAFTDIRACVSPSDALFTRIERQERDIAVLFLVDMSGSTRGWVNQAEKESLVLMSEALQTLGDRYAVYGFSGMTRNRCDLYRIKGFDEPYAANVKRRIAGIEPKDYTRMGPFIRHAVELLTAVDARTRLLITLSDSKPEDWDGYKGDYGIEDTRKALIEAKGKGIRLFCITIDREAASYLPHLFGAVNYVVIDEVRKLPSRITEIYRRLTA